MARRAPSVLPYGKPPPSRGRQERSPRAVILERRWQHRKRRISSRLCDAWREKLVIFCYEILELNTEGFLRSLRSLQNDSAEAIFVR